MLERLIKLRKILNLTQEKFAELIKINRSTYASYESGKREIKEIHIAAICHEFNVNEEWLRTGKGDTFLPESYEAIEQLIKDYRLTPKQTALIKAYLRLDTYGRNALIEFIQNCIEIQKEDENK